MQRGQLSGQLTTARNAFRTVFDKYTQGVSRGTITHENSHWWTTHETRENARERCTQRHLARIAGRHKATTLAWITRTNQHAFAFSVVRRTPLQSARERRPRGRRARASRRHITAPLSLARSAGARASRLLKFAARRRFDRGPRRGRLGRRAAQHGAAGAARRLGLIVDRIGDDRCEGTRDTYAQSGGSERGLSS